jgi:hypothetical protein
MPDTQTLEERMSHVEQDLAKLKSQFDGLYAKHGDTDQSTARTNGGSAAVNSPRGANPWLDGAGMFRNDPLFDDWQCAIAEYRRAVDADADAP